MAAGKEDIAPELLKKVQEDYRKRCENDKELARIEALAESGKANGKDTDAYAVRAGELLAAALHDNVSGDVLPDGKMYFNIASRVLPPVLRDNYELVAGMSTRIQQVLNDNAGLHMKALRPDLNEDRVKGLVNLAASADQYEDKRKELEADVVNFSQRISADGFHKNAEFQYTSGFNPKIRREAESGCCKWCQALEGTYDYYDVRDTGNDVWRRHRGCKCVVEYDPGTGRRQNAHTKTWSQADDHRKKIEDAERAMEERTNEQEIKNTDTWAMGYADDNFDRKTKNFTTEEDLIATNPNYAKSEEYQKNCQRCVPTYLLRKQGFDVIANPAYFGNKEDIEKVLATAGYKKYVKSDGTNPLVIFTRRSTTFGKAEIENYMSSLPEGAMCEVKCEWKKGGAHVFIAEKKNDIIKFIDPQTGNSDVSYYFDKMESGYTTFFRIDNTTVNEDYVWYIARNNRKKHV